MKATKINLKALRNEEHFQFHTEFKELVEKADPDTLRVELTFAIYLTLYNQEDEALEYIRKSGKTDLLFEADQQRDRTFRGFSAMAKAALNHFKPEAQTAAEELKILLKTYGDVALKSYDEETASIYNLLQELKGGYKAHVTTLGLTEWVTILEADNKAFDTLMKARYDEENSKTSFRMKQCREELDKQYKDVVERIEALSIAEGYARYTDFISQLNLRIDRFRQTLAVRKGHAQKKDEKS